MRRTTIYLDPGLEVLLKREMRRRNAARHRHRLRHYDRSDRWHARARALIEQERRGLILPAPVIPEVDHLLGHRLDGTGRQVFYQGILEGYYLVEDLPRGAYARVADLNRRFDRLDLGFVDGAIIALAEALRVSRVATTDRRHFDPLAAFSLHLLPDEARRSASASKCGRHGWSSAATSR